MSSLYSTAQYWLVDHPIIRQYEWKAYESPGASPLFVGATVGTYLSLTLTLQRRLPILPPSLLRPMTAVHSLLLCLLSLAMGVGCALSTLQQTPREQPTWALCFPAGRTRARGPTFFWAHVFYFSKILELLDTLLILVSASRARRLTFLHVYHHAAVVVMCYVWLEGPQSLLPVALVTNAAVHVVMYGYYLLCAVGVRVRPRWKRLVTDFQILQFVLSFLLSAWMLRIHFSSGSGCQGIRGWCFNALFNASLLALFLDFHFKNYAHKNQRNKTS